MTNVAKVLTIAGSDSGGGAGIQADLKTITALNGFGMSVITALTAQNTVGVHGVLDIPSDFIEKQFDAVAKDIGIDAAKTGMLANSQTVKIVARKIKEYEIKKLVVDPVMVAKGGALLIDNDAKQILIDELVPLSLVITPNIPEAEELSKMKISSVDDMKKSAKIIHKLGAKNVVVKGGHLLGDSVDVLYDGTNFYNFTCKRIDTKDTHGTGCTYSAAIALFLAKGLSVFESVKQAKEYVTTAIRFAIRIGNGHGPTNHFAPVMRECERYQCIEELKNALQKLKNEKCSNIIPEIQSNFGYAISQAFDYDDIAAVKGRIIKVGENVRTFHDPSFGASRHIASIILAVMKYDENFRSTMNIKFSERILQICKDLGYKMDSFDRSNEPKDIKIKEGSSLTWGINYVLSKRNTIPDIIFDLGDIGKEPIIRILGKNPNEVVEKVLNISIKLK